MELITGTGEATDDLVEQLQRINAKLDRILFLLTTDKITPPDSNCGYLNTPKPGEE